MTRWKLKSCPRCGGDMLIDRDMDFWYEQCLQCSYKVELQHLSSYKDKFEAAKASGKGNSEKKTTGIAN